MATARTPYRLVQRSLSRSGALFEFGKCLCDMAQYSLDLFPRKWVLRWNTAQRQKTSGRDVAWIPLFSQWDYRYYSSFRCWKSKRDLPSTIDITFTKTREV